MPIPTPPSPNSLAALLRAVGAAKGPALEVLPLRSTVAAIVGHGGLYTHRDVEGMSNRIKAFMRDQAKSPADQANSLAAATASATPPLTPAMVQQLRESAARFFYKLDDTTGYTVHSELMAYLTEPGSENGVTFDEGVDTSPHIPAAFTFVGQFIDHDLTFNGMNLTVSELGATVGDNASPLIDLDNVYGPDSATELGSDAFNSIFDDEGKFRLENKRLGPGQQYEDARRDDQGVAYIFDPRNDENQLILQTHLLVERLHNKIVDDPAYESEIRGRKPAEIVDRVRKEVVAIWQSFVLNDYMPAVILPDVLDFVKKEIHVKGSPAHPDQRYGELKHKPVRDPNTGKDVVRMPHEFAIGFRFGHSQLRPFYKLNDGDPAILFRDARHSDQVEIGGRMYNGRDDLRGGRELTPEHAINWNVYYPKTPTPETQSLLIDHKVTARVFNLPESAIPDDVKYIANLPHRNLIRGSQIGVVSGEELAKFFGVRPLTPDKVLDPDYRVESLKLFQLDPRPGTPEFKTPLWYYILKEAEVQSQGARLGELGSRLVAEVLAGAIYYGNEFAYDDKWVPKVIHPDHNDFTLHEIIDYVLTPAPPPPPPPGKASHKKGK